MKLELHWEPGSAALDAISMLVSRGPQPDVASETAKLCAEIIARHLISLIMTASDANLAGRHSTALSLFRNMEDALDCFAAVTMVPDAAEKWAKGELKASDAARLCEPILGEFVLVTGQQAPDYRKNLRSYFNRFAHCTPYLTDWDLVPDFEPSSIEALGQGRDMAGISAQLRVNHRGLILPENALRIVAYLAAHTIEFSSITEKGYSRFLERELELQRRLQQTRSQLEAALKEYGPVYLEEMPPQIKNPVIQHPENPNLVMRLDYPLKRSNDD